MNFPSIDIQGSILSSDLLAKIRTEQANFQQGKDFNTDFTNAKLKDEISAAWQEAKGQWTIFKSKIARLKEGDNGTTETRNFWISPLLTNLNYNLTFDRKGEELNGKSFPIGYRDSSLDNFPVYVGGYHESLDKRPENKQLRVSPHAMVQEYLNYSEHLYGIVTNGRQLRLLRDASRITRLSYVEFNLEKMMEEDLYSDFVILYRVLHASRMPKSVSTGPESIIEKYHQEGLEAGSTIRNKLGVAVKGAIRNLANGFINHPNNTALRNALAGGHINADEYYRHQLRIIYRLLFLFVIEERNLVYADSKSLETKRFNQIYFNYYSLLRLRKLAKKLLPPEASRYYDLWQSLVSTFSLFERKEIGEKLGIMSLQGDLFGYSAISNNYYDLHQCYVSNAELLNIIKSLSYFENDKGVLIAVNYGGLDVEEFGSVYEGLLELKLEFNKIEGTDNYSVDWKKQTGGREFQSHYTPEELVQPLIKHSLEYLIEDIFLPYSQKKANKENTIRSLLKLKVCDVACGSGHILLSAARRIALAVARVSSDEEQPNPLAIRKAMKDVVRNCIYGVDKNPLAVELCKIALWLEAFNPGEPLNFLDHHIKCGDAIVGLAHRSELENGIPDDAFKTLPGDDKEIAKTYRDRNVKERKERAVKANQLKAEFEKTTENWVDEAMAHYKTFNQLPETTPDEIERKGIAYKKFIDGKGFTFLRAMADTQISQFFIPKTEANKDALMTDADFRLIIGGYKGWQDKKVAKATAVAMERRFFHWFIEFPEVFDEGGFSCILGNPPYLGGNKISGLFGLYYLNILSKSYSEVGGQADLVTYFLRRIYRILSNEKFLSIITTNTISQGDTRKGGLDILLHERAVINFAIKSMPWPGIANLQISLLSIAKNRIITPKILNNISVNHINSYLSDEINSTNPFPLQINKRKSFKGSDIMGEGFILSVVESETLIKNNPNNREVIFPFINGNDLVDDPYQRPSRWIINFFDWPLERAAKYKDCITILENKVKPERLLKNRDRNRKYWWLYCENRPGLYSSIKNLNSFFIIPATSKYFCPSLISNGFVYSKANIIFPTNKFSFYSLLQSNLHESWAWKYSSTLDTRLRYASTDVYETFPFPPDLNQQWEESLEDIGEVYHEHRKHLMFDVQLGLTKIYNLFHSNAITSQNIDDKDKQVASLDKHLEKTHDTISFNEAIQGILKLRELHKQIDTAVLDAYGWNDIAMKHDFHEVDYLPENDRIRYTIHPEARKEVLKRLLELNHKIHEEEVKKGLWEKKLIKTVPKKEEKQERQQLSLIPQFERNMIDLGLHQGIYSIGETAVITGFSPQKVASWFKELSKEKYEGLNGKDIENKRISFHGLIELVVIGTLRDNGFKLKKILKARADLAAKTKKSYPFATNNVRERLKVSGSDIIWEFEDDLKVTLDGSSQINIDFITLFFNDIEFSAEGFAERLMPAKGNFKVIIDPKVGLGKPVIARKEVPVDIIASTFKKNPQSITLIERQYGLNEEEIMAAVAYMQ